MVLKAELDEAGLSCSCPSGCFELTYNVETSYADYPSAVAEEKVPCYLMQGDSSMNLMFEFK